MWNFSNICWEEGNLPQVADLSWSIQAHAATFSLIPHCNVPNPQTGKEDATKPSKHLGKYPDQIEHAHNAEIKNLNIIHTKMHNASYT